MSDQRQQAAGEGGEDIFVYEEQAYGPEFTAGLEDISPYGTALDQIRQRLAHSYKADQINAGGPQVAAELEKIGRAVYQDYNTRALHNTEPTLETPLEIFISQIKSDILGMGPLEPLLKDASIEDIAINGPGEVMVFRHGAWELSPVTFDSRERLLEVLNRAISNSNRQVNMVTPIADAILPGGERINVGTAPIANPFPSAVIRVPRATSLTLAEMVQPYQKRPRGTPPTESENQKWAQAYAGLQEGGMLTAAAARYLHAAVLAGLNIVVIGPTGVGKTTLLSALGRCIPSRERILVIEDTPEINIHPDQPTPQNVLYLRTRPASVDGATPAILQADLVKLALRHRPDALTLGEARGAEVFDLLNALNTGHKNGLTSIHAAEVYELFNRIYLMLGQSEAGRTLDKYRAAYLVSNALHIAISLELVKKPGSAIRRIKTIGELSGRILGEGDLIEPEILPLFQQSGETANDLRGPLRTSVHAHKFAEAGIPQAYFSPLEATPAAGDV